MVILTREETAALRYVESWMRGGAPLNDHQQHAAYLALAIRRLIADTTIQLPPEDPRET